MTDQPDVYLELLEHVGLAPSHVRLPDGREVENPIAGEPEPLSNIRFQIPIPTMVGGELVMTTASSEAKPAEQLDPRTKTRIVPGTRLVHTQAPAVVEVLLNTGLYRVCDPPEKAAANRQAKKKAQLAEEARALGIDIVAGMTKPDIIKAIEAAERPQVADQAAPDAKAKIEADAEAERQAAEQERLDKEATAAAAGDEANPDAPHGEE